MNNFFSRFSSAAALVCAALSASAGSSAATVTVSPGDLLMAFYQVTSDGTGVESETRVLNLGAGATYRETAASTVLVGNIKADLDSAFGATWAENPNVRCCIIGGVGPTDTTTGGDPARTTYFARAASAFTPGTTTAPVMSSAQRGNVATFIKTFSVAVDGKPSGVSSNVAQMPTSVNSDVTEFVPPASSTSFGFSSSPATSFGVGNLGSAGSYMVEASLDIYRILHSTSGADLTAAKSAASAAVGGGQYIGTFTISAAGDVRYDVPQTTASGYAAWAAGKGLTAGNSGAAADPEADGIPNAVEFVIGGEPLQHGDTAKLPILSSAGAGSMSFSFRRADAAAYLLPAVEHDADLLGAWTTAVNGSGGVAVTAEDDFYGAGLDRVTVLIPSAGTAHFARLRVTVP